MVMKWRLLITILSLACGLPQGAVAAADPNSIRILAGGENYQGPPIMIVRADGAVIATVPVTNAVATIAPGQVTEDSMAATLKPYDFIVPSLKNVSVLRIEFDNDKWSGSSATGDRNLWIGAVTAGDTAIAPAQFALPEKGATRYGSVIVLARNDGIDIKRPPGGWQPVKIAAQEPACSGKASIVLSDYATNQTEPSEADAAQLAKSFAKIRGLSRCRLTVSSSTSPAGTPEVNALIANLRAEAVSSLAVKAGANARRIKIAPPQSGKRTVTVSVGP